MKHHCLAMAAGVALAMLGSLIARADDGATYTVAPGDALTTIASRFGTTADELLRINDLANPNRIRIGQQLIIPLHSAPALSTSLSGDYVVIPGDTVEHIAVRFGITVDELASANNLGNPNRLQIGQRITIPSSRSNIRVEVQPGDATAIFANSNQLQLPYRSQFDGSRYNDSNCGPAALSMVMGYYDEWWSSDGIRRDVNTYTGDWSLDGGSSWESLVYAARKRGFLTMRLMEGNGFHRWTFDELMDQVRAGNPPLLLVRFRNLPGHQGSSWWGDHYIVFLGLTPDGYVVYHDSAFYGSDGAYRQMTRQQLMRAWSTNIAGIEYSAAVLKWALPVE